MTRPLIAAVLTGLVALAACNGDGNGNAQKAGSGAGPTQGAGSSNQPGTASNGGPAAE